MLLVSIAALFNLNHRFVWYAWVGPSSRNDGGVETCHPKLNENVVRLTYKRFV